MSDKQSKSRFLFKKNINYDLALLREVEGLNPYAQKVNKGVWDSIAINLQSCALKMEVTGRSCRERTEKLIKQFRAEERLSVQASGVEESEMDEVKQLLTSVCKLEDVKAQTPGIEKLYSKKNRLEAEKIQEEALNSLQDPNFAEMSTDDVITWVENQPSGSISTEIKDTSSSEDVHANTKSAEGNPIKRDVEDKEDRVLPKKYRPNVGSSSLIKYLEDKHKGELHFKERELEVRKLEAENKSKELEMAKDRQDQDIEERRKLNNVLFNFLEKKLD